MRCLAVSFLALVSLAGCLQLTSPEHQIEKTSLRRSSPQADRKSPLVLSVKLDAHVVAADWILVVTLEIRNTANETVVLGTSPGCYLRLNLEDSEGQAVKEYCLGQGVLSPLTINAKQTWSASIEIPADLEPGLYRFTLSTTGVDQTSAPCTFQIVPPRDTPPQLT